MSDNEIKTKAWYNIKKLMFLATVGCTGALSKQANDKIEPYVVNTLK